MKVLEQPSNNDDRVLDLGKVYGGSCEVSKAHVFVMWIEFANEHFHSGVAWLETCRYGQFESFYEIMP